LPNLLSEKSGVAHSVPFLSDGDPLSSAAASYVTPPCFEDNSIRPATMSASPPSNSVNGSLPVVLRALLPFLISQAYVVWLVASSDIDGFQAMVMYVPEVLLASFSSAFLFSRSADVLANRTRQFLALLLGSFVLLVMLLLACTPPAGAENADQQPGERMLAYARQALSGDLALRGSIYLVISFAASLVQAFASADPQRTWYDNVVRPAFYCVSGHLPQRVPFPDRRPRDRLARGASRRRSVGSHPALARIAVPRPDVHCVARADDLVLALALDAGAA